MAKTTLVYQLKATLLDIKPAIWRRIQVPANLTLGNLHLVLQDAFGWDNAHLHQFEIDRRRFGMTGVEEFEDELEDERSVKLNELAQLGARLVYEYDFGDGWEHEIVIEGILLADPEMRYPVCLDGRRACPPEDCGGPHAYADLVTTLKRPSTKRYAELLEWLGDDFDPELFDLKSTNAALRPSGRRRAAS